MRHIKGFTLIELMIVVVVVAIIVAVTVVAYNGVQSRARDTKIRAAAEHIQDALEIYIAQNGRRPNGGWGSSTAFSNGDCANGADGWFAKSTYTCTPDEVLTAANLIPADLITKLPPNKVSSNSPLYVFMLYGCPGGTKLKLMWYLESPSAQDIADYDAAHTACSLQDFRSSYGMQGAVLIDM